METKPLISILMPIYNGEKYLAEAIDSVLSQTYEHWELVLLDDGSSDNSLGIIYSYTDRRIRFAQNEQNLGIVATRNKLFDMAKGVYFAIMDCDDIFYPEKLEKQVAFMEQNLTCGVCGTWARKIAADGKSIGTIQPPVEDQYIKINLLFQSSFIHSASLIRKEALGDLRYEKEFPVCVDFNLWERLKSDTFFYNIPEYLVAYRWHNENISTEKGKLQENKRNEIIIRQLSSFGDFTKEEEQQVITIGNLLPIANKEMKKLTNVLEKLLETNQRNHIFDTTRFMAFLTYRWIFYCFAMKHYRAIFLLKIRWYAPNVFLHLLRLTVRKVWN